MKYNLTTAKRIAYFEAKKMSAQGYTMKPAASGARYWVTTPDENNEYLVNPAEGIEEPCTCPFSEENSICKHTYWVRWNLEDEAQCDEAADAAAIIREEEADAIERYYAR